MSSSTIERPGAYRHIAEIVDRLWSGAPWDRFADLCLEAFPGGRPRRVVVAACGTGSLAVQFAGRGMPTVGFDLSPFALRRAAGKRPSGAPLGLVLGDLRAVPLATGCAELVTALNTSINYLPRWDDVVVSLRELGRLTSPGGRVVVEPLSRRFMDAGVEENRHVVSDELRFDATYKTRGPLLIERLQWTAAGCHHDETYVQRFFDDDELTRLFEEAGLDVVERRPMHPAIDAAPALGRVLWVGAAR